MIKLSNLDIEHLIESKQSFALYRLPKEQKGYFFEGEALKMLSSLKELDGEEGFLFAPFDINEESKPLLLIKGDSKALELDCYSSTSYTLARETNYNEQKSKANYTNDFLKFKEALEQDKFKKLVLARSKDLSFQEKLEPKKLFAKACQQYESAYCYLVYTPISGLWLGASPECLLSSEGQDCSTVALAGTQTLKDKSDKLVWSEELQEEQDCVLKFIEESLRSFGIKIKQSEAYTISAGHLAHIKTDISFRLNTPQEMTQVLEQLHPTPALCGLEQKQAQDFILKNENLERSYYGGFFGLINSESSKLYVNIRCMQMLDPKTIRLYAGGGLLKASKLEKEWQETEAKMKTMQKIL